MAWTLNDLSDAVSYITGQCKQKLQELNHLAVWTWEVIQGDFNDDPDVSHVVANTAVSIGVTMTGIGVIVAWLMDLRDLVANGIKIYQAANDSSTNKLDFGKVSPLLWIALIATLIGVIPALGDLGKGVFKIILIFFKKALRTMGDIPLAKIMAKAIDDAMPHIKELLGNPKIKQWLTQNGWARPFSELAKCFKKVKPLITQKQLMGMYDLCISELKKVIDSIKKYLPFGADRKIEELFKKLTSVRDGLEKAVAKFIKPFQDCIDEIIIRLEKEDYVAYTARTGRIDEHYFGRISPDNPNIAWQEARKSSYLVNRKVPPFPEAVSAEYVDEVSRAVNRGWPNIPPDKIPTFHKMYRVEIRGPAKLYRVVDPDSYKAGRYWMREEDFAKLNSRADWRSECAVKHEWNANGQYVEYEIKAGESVKVWEGPAASQAYDDSKEVWYKGGGNQIYFDPQQSVVSARKATGWGYIDQDEHFLNERVLVDLSGGNKP